MLVIDKVGRSLPGPEGSGNDRRDDVRRVEGLLRDAASELDRLLALPPVSGGPAMYLEEAANAVQLALVELRNSQLDAPPSVRTQTGSPRGGRPAGH